MYHTLDKRRQRIVRARLIVEAALYLLGARLALRVLPFRWLTGFFERPLQGPEAAGATRAHYRRAVEWAILRAARYLDAHAPGPTVCFPRAVAAQAMLRRRGVPATLYYGAVTRPDEGLRTHAWVQDGDVGIVGNIAAEGYHVLARYPAAPAGERTNSITAGDDPLVHHHQTHRRPHDERER